MREYVWTHSTAQAKAASARCRRKTLCGRQQEGGSASFFRWRKWNNASPYGWWRAWPLRGARDGARPYPPRRCNARDNLADRNPCQIALSCREMTCAGLSAKITGKEASLFEARAKMGAISLARRRTAVPIGRPRRSHAARSTTTPSNLATVPHQGENPPCLDIPPEQIAPGGAENDEDAMGQNFAVTEIAKLSGPQSADRWCVTWLEPNFARAIRSPILGGLFAEFVAPRFFVVEGFFDRGLRP